MRRLTPSRLAGALLVVAVTAISSSALAFFTSEGVGEAEAEVSQLSVPKITSATPAAGGKVSLVWSSVVAPGTGAVTYYVTRDGGNPAGTCAAPAVPTAATSCTDAQVSIGTHTYTVTVVWRAWSATSTVASANVTVGEPVELTIAAATQAPAVGASNNLTIAAKDENGSTVTTYTGSHSLTFSGASSSPNSNAPTVANSSGSATAFGSATALNFSNGVASVSSSKNGVMKIFRAGLASIVATEASSGLATTAPLQVNVVSGAPTKYTLAAATTTPAVGAANGLTITAVDTYGNASASYTGPKSLTFSGASASPGGTLPTVTDSAGAVVPFGTATTVEFEAGVATADGVANGEMALYKSGSASVKASDGSLTNSTALSVTVAAGAATKLVLTSSTATPVAAASSNLTTTAKDAYENNATSYTGAKSVTFSGAVAGPAGTAPTVVNSAGTVVAFGSPTALSFSSGVAAVSSSKNGLMRLYKAGATSISATDGTISTAAPLAVTVGVGTAARLAMTAVTASAGTVGPTCLFTCSVIGLGNSGTISANVSVTDSAGNTVSNVGTGHGVKVTATTGGTIIEGALTIIDTGPAVSSARFTYTAPASGSFSHTITAAVSLGTTYTSATITATK
jgi:hypothetical protein